MTNTLREGLVKLADDLEGQDPDRATVQASSKLSLRRRRERTGEPGEVPGTISWAEHLEAFEDYAKRYGRDQSALRVHERGGFGYCELLDHLGRAPTTWRAR